MIIVSYLFIPANLNGSALIGVFGCSGRPLVLFHILVPQDQVKLASFEYLSYSNPLPCNAKNLE